MRKRERLVEVARVLAELLASEGRLRWRRGRNTSADPELYERQRALALRQGLERLGPLYIKLGQILSTRPDIVSAPIIDALQDLHEEVNVRPFAEFEPVLEANLGAHWRNRFAAIDTDRPLGAASIAQVYGARRRNGEEVAIKIQRPGVATAARLDMEILARAVKLAMRRLPDVSEILQPEAMLETVFSAMRPEIDFTVEAKNIDEFGGLLRRYDHLQVPRVVQATKQVLVMSKAPGTSIRECRVDDFTQAERVDIGQDVITSMLRGLLVDGVFHGDPHPGNIFVAPGEPATFIDFGIIGRVDRQTSLGYTRFMIAMAVNDGEAAGRAGVELGTLTARADVAAFLSDMQRYIPTMANQSLEQMEFGTSLNRVLTFYAKRGIAVNPGIALFGKAYANMEGSLRRFVPELAPFEVFRDVMGSIIRDQFRHLQSGGELLRLASETLLATRSLPGQLRYLANSIVNGQYVLRLRDDSHLAHEAREDARAQAMRRTLWGITALVLWHDHRHRGA